MAAVDSMATAGAAATPPDRAWWRRLGPRDWLLIAMAVFYAACVLLVPYVMPHDPNQVGLTAPLAGPSSTTPLGADYLGRDVLSRLIAASQIAVIAPAESILMALVVGGLLGVVAAYLGGVGEFLIMRFADFLFSFPGFLVAIILIAALGPGLQQATVAIGIIYMPRFIRVARVQAATVMRSSYVDAAYLARRSGPFIMARHVIPNISTPMVVLSAVDLSTAQLTYAGLSFLGFGARAPQADLGGMLAQARLYMLVDPFLVVAPAIVLTFFVLSFNLFGDILRSRLDPRGGRHIV